MFKLSELSGVLRILKDFERRFFSPEKVAKFANLKVDCTVHTTQIKKIPLTVLRLCW